MWISLALASSVGLGLYDIAKKHGVRNNAVMPVLGLATAIGSTAFVAATLLTGQGTDVLALSAHDSGLIALKAFLVAGSWILAYYAMRALPI